MKTLSLPYQKAISASIEASEVIMNFYSNGFNSQYKSDGSPVTEADFASSKVILKYLEETNIPVLGEESEHQHFDIRKNWTLNWCVDPLDGTKEYIKRNGEFAVNIALIENEIAIFGVIAWPVERKVLFGGKEIGAFIVSFDEIHQSEKWIKLVAQDSINSPIVMATSRTPHSGASAEFIESLKKEYSEIDFLKKGSALKFFDLATGSADIYPRFAPTMEWDIAAGQAILEAVGGTVCSVETGKPLTYNKENLFNPFFVAKTKALLPFLFCLFFFAGFSQQNLMPLNSYFKDKIYSPLKGKPYNNGSFLPVSQKEYDLESLNADTSLQYFDFTELMLKHYLIEVKGEDFNFSVTPLLDLSRGKNREDSTGTKFYQNTRGLQIEGDLLKTVSFSTAFYENQSLFIDYERAYYNSVGELYPNTNGTYSTQNAVIPGAARTKPFKGNGFDYAYAIGNVVYSPFKKLQFSGGNNAHFIGAGHRSLLLSDNSINAPYIQVNYFISKRFSYVFMRERLFNLMRRPIKTTDEAYYEPKGYSVNYLTFKPTESISLSVFDGIIWSKGDSVSAQPVNPWFYNPIPGLTEAAYSNSKQMSSLLGLNLEVIFLKNYRLYSQVAMSNLNSKHVGFQLGVRGYNFFKVKNLMLQLEYNDVPSTLYAATNRRLNYSQYNLPLAHTKGAGFQEFIIRFNYEFKRFYVDYKTIMYQLRDYQLNSLLAVNKIQVIQNNQLYHHQIEAGYRINRKINFTAFVTWVNRNDYAPINFKTNFINVGIRTGLINHYNDF
ncbi:MAG: 3'(2'),5'-bisphosphate nucleotidase CysQ [Fluviicola sp.]|nr:3'(2'),5'-bisphosphate nucleotidase CysQ [Fluviicola sp.]